MVASHRKAGPRAGLPQFRRRQPHCCITATKQAAPIAATKRPWSRAGWRSCELQENPSQTKNAAPGIPEGGVLHSLRQSSMPCQPVRD